MRITRVLAAAVVAAAVATQLVTGAGTGAAAAAPPDAAAPAANPLTAAAARTLDLQAHRGGIALTVENTLPAFAKALRLGVTTLELDTQVTRDRKVVVTHDRQISSTKCRDTAPAVPGDRQWPYVGDYIKDLKLAQVRTLDCGSLAQEQFPGQETAPGSRMPLLSEVFALVRQYRAYGVKLNIETKVEAGAPEQTMPRTPFVRAVSRELTSSGLADQVSIQSFDWGSLRLMKQLQPSVPLVALDNIDFLQVGQPGRSPWLGGLDIDDFDGDVVAALSVLGVQAWSPVQGTPQGGTVGDGTFVPYPTRALVGRAHAADLMVIPWTVDDPATMGWFMDQGVDGLITDRPDVLRDVMTRRGYALPTAYADPAAGRVTPVPGAHAHNDYEHTRPLRDALAQGFTSVEADVWLVDGELRVAHDLEDSAAGRTLRSLYLEPLAKRVAAQGGSTYRGWDGSLQLLVDLKSDGPSTYAALSRELRDYQSILTRFAPTLRDGAVEVVVSGNRPLPQMLAQKQRFAGYDGRLADLTSGLPATVMPLVSDNWTSNFTWTGEGPMPAAEQEKLRRILHTAHAKGYRVRFWETPDVAGLDRTTLWSVLADEGVDHLNSDDLTGLSDFLTVRPLTD